MGKPRPEQCSKIGVWRLKGVRRKDQEVICPACSKDEFVYKILWYEGIKVWRKEILGKTFSNISAQIDIAMLMDSKNENKWLKI
jgi:hypothetical protein